MRISPTEKRYSSCWLRLVFAAAFAAALVLPLCHASAQSPAASPAPAASTAAPAPASGAAKSSQSDDDEEQSLLHGSTVQLVARILHLNIDTTIVILVAINFAVIFFAIVIPLGRFMPKVIRKRSQSLRHDLESARAATAEAQARLSAVEAKLAGLAGEIESFRTQVEQDILEDEKRIKASLGEESARIVAAAEQEIEVAATQARRGLRSFAADLAIEHASKQLVLTPETDRTLIKEFVAGVAADAPGKGGRN